MRYLFIFLLASSAFATDFIENVDGGVALDAGTSVLLQSGSGPVGISSGADSDIDIESGGNVVLESGAGYPIYAAGESLQVMTDHGIQLTATASQLDCNASSAGTLYYLMGASGVADQLQICLKAADDSYSWKSVSF